MSAGWLMPQELGENKVVDLKPLTLHIVMSAL